MLCNCASIALGVVLVMSQPTGAYRAPCPAAQSLDRASFCGDERDCLAGSEAATAISGFIGGFIPR
jgi:hypothetical protein